MLETVPVIATVILIVVAVSGITISIGNINIGRFTKEKDDD